MASSRTGACVNGSRWWAGMPRSSFPINCEAERNAMKNMWRVVAVVAAFGAGFVVRGLVPGESVVSAQSARVFELRTYTAPEGKLEELHARFKNHTVRIFNRHHMTS